MASIISLDGSRYIGCQIVYKIQAGNIDDSATFHRVRLVVTITSSDGTSTPFEFSTPAADNEDVYFDISSAFRAMADQYEYTPAGMDSYPYWTLVADAYDDYLLNGVEHRGENQAHSVDDGHFYVGKLTDRERLTGERPAIYSRKPASPEICFIGNPHLHAGAFGNNPSVSSTQVTKGMQTIGGHQVYGINQPADGFELRFINSLGVHENVFITCLRQTEVNIKNDFHVIARQETLTNFSRGINIKQNDYETWKMSSGPVDRARQQYYLHEVLMAKWAWLNVDGQWLPVHIISEETVTGIDRAKGNLLEVQFTIRFDINGNSFKS